MYNSGRFRKPRVHNHNHRRQTPSTFGPSELQSEADVSQYPPDPFNPVPLNVRTDANETSNEGEAWKSEILGRIAILEGQLQLGGHTATGTASSLALNSSGALADISVCVNGDGDHDEDPDGDGSRLRFQSGTDLTTPISKLELKVNCIFGIGSELADTTMHSMKMPAPSPPYHQLNSPPGLSACCARALRLWNESTKDEDVERLRSYVNAYFTCMNRHRKNLALQE